MQGVIDNAVAIYNYCLTWLLSINFLGEWTIQTYILWFLIIGVLIRLLLSLAGLKK